MVSATEVQQAWKEAFPEGYSTVKTILGSTCVALWSLKPEECHNGIQANDPFSYLVWVHTDDPTGKVKVEVVDKGARVLTNPPKDANLVYDHANMRGHTFKDPTYDQILRRFKKTVAWLKQQDVAHEELRNKL